MELQSLIEENKFNNSYKEYATYKLKKYSNVFLQISIYMISMETYTLPLDQKFLMRVWWEKMNAAAFLQIALNKKPEFIHDENIGNLAYLSAYLPVKIRRDEFKHTSTCLILQNKVTSRKRYHLLWLR